MPRGALYLRIGFQVQGCLPKRCLRKNALLRPERFSGACFLEEASPDQGPQDLRVKIGHHDIIVWEMLWRWVTVEGSTQIGTKGAVFSLYVDYV